MSESSLEPEKKGITRRQFLKWGAVAAGAAVLTSGEIEKRLIESFTQLLANPQNAEKALRFFADRLGNERENPHYRSMDKIIEEGIQQYEIQSGNRAFFRRRPEYQDFSYYQEKIEAATKSIGLLAEDPRKIVESILEELSPETKSAFVSADKNFGDYLGVMSDGGGMYERFCQEFPRDARKPFIGQELIDRVRVSTKKYIVETKDYVENEAQKNGDKPVSASRILSFFLDKNTGDISQSLIDTFTFLKFAARNDFESADFVASEGNIAWMKSNILDEYGSNAYDRETNEQINLIGKPYHSWNLVALLAYFPPEVVVIGGMYEQLTNLPAQKATKLNADLLTLVDLKKIELSLLSH